MKKLLSVLLSLMLLCCAAVPAMAGSETTHLVFWHSCPRRPVCC